MYVNSEKRTPSIEGYFGLLSVFLLLRRLLVLLGYVLLSRALAFGGSLIRRPLRVGAAGDTRAQVENQYGK